MMAFPAPPLGSLTPFLVGRFGSGRVILPHQRGFPVSTRITRRTPCIVFSTLQKRSHLWETGPTTSPRLPRPSPPRTLGSRHIHGLWKTLRLCPFQEVLPRFAIPTTVSKSCHIHTFPSDCRPFNEFSRVRTNSSQRQQILPRNISICDDASKDDP